MDTQQPQSSAIAEAIAAVQDAMAALKVEGKALDDSDLRLLMHIRASRDSGEGDSPEPTCFGLEAIDKYRYNKCRQ